MKLGKELFLDIVRPSALVHDGRDEDGIHEAHQALQVIFLNLPDQDFPIDIISIDCVLAEVEDQGSIVGNFMRDLS